MSEPNGAAENAEFSIGEVWLYVTVMTVAGLAGLTVLFRFF